jgi:hypothetical protein
MNERIKTLAKVAGYDEINKAAMKLIGFDPEKFAELIVKECIRLCDEVDLAGADDCIDKIKDNFGVEE